MKTNSRFIGSVACVIMLTAGCGVKRRPSEQISNFLIQPEIKIPDSTFEKLSCIIIRPVTTQSSFRNLNMTYRVGEVEFESDYYNRYMTSPPNQITEAIRQWAIALHWNACPEEMPDLNADYFILRPVLQSFYGDFRDRNPAAFVEIRFTLTHVDPSCNCSKVLLSELYTSRITMQSSDPAALVEAQTKAIENILNQLENRLAELVL